MTYRDINELKASQDTNPDFREGEMRTDSMIIYMGHPLDLVTKKGPSYLLGTVLYPEGRNDIWTIIKNQAFFAGGIVAGKTFKLLTRIDIYLNRKNPGIVMQEILWLSENGYSFTVNNDRTVTCKPPEQGILLPKIRNFDSKREDRIEIIEKFNALAEKCNFFQKENFAVATGKNFSEPGISLTPEWRRVSFKGRISSTSEPFQGENRGYCFKQ